jgi:prolipoprotein diacylglyceryl transferase
MKNIKSLKLVFVITVLAFFALEILAMKEVITIPPTIDLQIIQFRSYGVLIMAAVGLMTWIFSREKKTIKDFKKIHLDDLLLFAVIPGIIGARLYHLATDWQLYVSDPIAALYIWNGGVGIFGAIAGGMLGIYVYSRRLKISLWKIIDVLAVYMPLAQIIGRMGNLVNKELFGFTTDLPWNWQISGLGNFHPVFLYEQLLNLIVFCVLYWAYSKHKFELGSGKLTLIYVIGYSCARFVVEFFRRETRILLDVLTVNQIVCLVLLVVCAIIWFKIRRKS